GGAGGPAGAAARRPRHGPRAGHGPGPGPLPGRRRGARPPDRGGRGGTARRPRRRRPVARPSVGPGAGFVARRLPAAPVALVLALRTPGDTGDPAGLPALLVDALGATDARALLAAVVPGRLDERVRDRLVAETRGNPRALVEVSWRSTAAGLAGGFRPPGTRPLADPT